MDEDLARRLVEAAETIGHRLWWVCLWLLMIALNSCHH